MLLIDAGNSRIKWALTEGGRFGPQGAADVGAWEALRQVFASLAPPHKILVSNVAGDEVARQLRAVCAAWACPPEFIVARAEQCGVRNAYAEPAQLGSDRWAALIAAWRIERAACLVVNCGTATTIDALSGAGEFLGGLILPGMEMMRRSLAAGAAQLGMDEGSWRAFPRNTADAIASGAIQATVGAILRQYELLGAPGARCLLSGGAADGIQRYLDFELAQRECPPGLLEDGAVLCAGLPLSRVENLVLQGLQIIGGSEQK